MLETKSYYCVKLDFWLPMCQIFCRGHAQSWSKMEVSAFSNPGESLPILNTLANIVNLNFVSESSTTQSTAIKDLLCMQMIIH